MDKRLMLGKAEMCMGHCRSTIGQTSGSEELGNVAKEAMYQLHGHAREIQSCDLLQADIRLLYVQVCRDKVIRPASETAAGDESAAEGHPVMFLLHHHHPHVKALAHHQRHDELPITSAGLK